MISGHLHVRGVRDEYLSQLEMSSGFDLCRWLESEESLQALYTFLDVRRIGGSEVLAQS